MEEVVICLDNRNRPTFVFGPFPRLKGFAFKLDHELFCEREHVLRKLNDPKFGLK